MSITGLSFSKAGSEVWSQSMFELSSQIRNVSTDKEDDDKDEKDHLKTSYTLRRRREVSLGETKLL